MVVAGESFPSKNFHLVGGISPKFDAVKKSSWQISKGFSYFFSYVLFLQKAPYKIPSDFQIVTLFGEGSEGKIHICRVMRAHARTRVRVKVRVKTVFQTEGDFVSTFSQPDKTTSESEKIISDLNLFPSQITLLLFTHKIKTTAYGIKYMP